MGYYVGVQDWPASARTANLSPDDIFDALDGLDEYFQPAMESLKKTADEGLARLDEEDASAATQDRAGD